MNRQGTEGKEASVKNTCSTQYLHLQGDQTSCSEKTNVPI